MDQIKQDNRNLGGSGLEFLVGKSERRRAGEGGNYIGGEQGSFKPAASEKENLLGENVTRQKQFE